MLDPSKAKSQSTPAKLTSEFTSGQLIVAICMFLILALICFSLGVLVGRYEGRHEANPIRSAQVRAPEPATPMPPGPRTLEQPGRQEGVQTSPRMLPGAQPQKPPMPGFPSSPGMQGPPKTEPNVSELPAPQAKPVPPSAPTPPVEPSPATSGAGAVTPPATPATTQTPPAPQPPAADAPTEKNVAKPEDKTVAPEPTTPVATPPIATPAVATPPVAMPPAATPPVQPLPGASASPSMIPAEAKNTPAAPAAAAPGKGTYAIQVASFSGAKRKENAEQYRKRLTSNAGLESDLLPSEDGKMLRVLVGAYPDKATAVKACGELKKRAGFSDSFVKRR